MTTNQTHVVQALRPGGIESLALSLAKKAGPGFEIASLDGKADHLVAGWPALQPVRNALTGFAKRGGVTPGLVLQLAKHFRASGTKAVVTHHVGPLLYAGLAARLARVPVIVHVEHDAWHYRDAKRRRLGRLLMSVIRPRLAAVSEAVADGVCEAIGQRPQVIPNGADIERFAPSDKAAARSRLGLPLDKRIIGGAGRIEQVKGFDLLIRAMPLLPEDMVAVIFGTGSQVQACRELAHELGVGHRVTFAGLSSAMEGVYPAFDLFCLPSRSEGLPLAALEAQACGVRVAAFNVGGVREAVDPQTGQLANANDPECLAKAITAVFARPPAQSPRDFICDRFSFDQTARAYDAITRDISNA